MRITLLLTTLLLLTGCLVTNQPPKMTIASPTQGETLQQPINITIYAYDDNSNRVNFTLYLDGTIIEQSILRNSSSRTFTDIQPGAGTHTIHLSATDLKGKQGNATPVTFTIKADWNECLGTVVPTQLVIPPPPYTTLITRTWSTGYNAAEDDGGIQCHWGREQGENINYLYCNGITATARAITETGEILSTKYYYVELHGSYAEKYRAGDELTNKNTQLTVLTATCKEAYPPVTDRCTETDNGIDYTTKGELSTGASDVCGRPDSTGRTQDLREYYCKRDGTPGFLQHTCPGACIDGACA